MNKTDKELMVEYGIICEQVSVYRYKKFQYNRLQDAVNYARLDLDQNPVVHTSEPEKISSNRDVGEEG